MFDLVDYRNLGDAFAAHVAAHPEETALTIYRGSAAAVEQESLTFAELARRGAVRAARLGARFAPGERVLIALPTGTEFVEVYLACLIAGLIAVPAPAPSGSAAATERVVAIAGDCVPALALTTRGDRTALAERLRALGLGSVPVEEAGDAGPGEGSLPLAQGLDRDALAILQYSSGSTGVPKGVMLSHGNVLANLGMMNRCCDTRPGDTYGSWLPLHHDMGLLGMLSMALMHGEHIALMPPTDFVRRPVEWFRLMDRYGITITAVPDFALDLCVRLIADEALGDLDLSRLRLVCDGSEPVNAATMTAFNERFARIGLRPGVVSPCYGLAEATLYVCANPTGAQPDVLVADPRRLEAAERSELLAAPGGEGRAIVGVGRPVGTEARIVHPDSGRRLPDGSVGEIWLRGPSIGRGYWNRPELSASVFAARLAYDAGDPGDSGPPWLRTGDLGALVDGELFVTGRLKEMIIVRGRNLFPQDLEREAQAAHRALAGFVGAAFGVAAPDERIVLVHEVSPKAPAGELRAVATAVKQRLTVEFGVPCRNVLLVRRGKVRRTTSGKIQRAAMRERFLAGDLVALHAELDPDVLRISQGGAA